MSKIILRENIHLEVYPHRSLRDDEDDTILDCKYMKEQIERHIDDVANVDVTWNSRTVCSFCGLDWEVNDRSDDPDCLLGEPLCCAKAQDEWRKENQETIGGDSNG